MSEERQYDVVVVGAGPAGLSAARTAARLGFSTLVLERLHQAGELRHPCTGVITPVPGFITGRRLLEGIFLPSVDLLIPAALIVGFPPAQRMVSPSGYQFQASFATQTDFPAAVIDKRGMLQLMARQAHSAGAQLRFGAQVTELVKDGERVQGVQVDGETIRSRIVISAEGTARRLCVQAGVGSPEPPRQHLILMSQDMEAPRVGEEHLGQVLTAGKRYTSAPQAFGMVVYPAPGRASVFFNIYVDAEQHMPDAFLWFYLDEYVKTDVRVRELLADARVLGRSRQKVGLYESPARVVADGFMGLGDAITPAGHLGILPSIYMGRQAALVAAEALDAGDTSAQGLAAYDRLLHTSILPNLETEAKIMLGMTKMADGEIDRLCQSLNDLHLATPFFSNWRTLAWDMVGWMIRRFPLMIHDWQLLQQAGEAAGGEKPLPPV